MQDNSHVGIQETWRRTGSRDWMASGMVQLQETVEQSDRCRHKFGQPFFSIQFFQSGRPIGLSPSRDSRVGVLEVWRWQQRNRVGWDVTDAGEGQGATRLAVDDCKLPIGLAFQPRGLGRRTSFEGCVTESLLTITAILFVSAGNDSAVTGQHAWIWWKCLCPFSECKP